MYLSHVEIDSLIGKTFSSVGQGFNSEDNNDAIIFTMEDGTQYQLTHDQDCCETVYIESIVGDLADLEGTPILSAEESKSEAPPKGNSDDSSTWSFYKFRTKKGYVDIRFYGSSNGYYGETADLYLVSSKAPWED